jgi:hypothetical protein
MKHFNTTLELHQFWDNKPWRIVRRKYDNMIEVSQFRYHPELLNDPEIFEKRKESLQKQWIVTHIFKTYKKALDFVNKLYKGDEDATPERKA